MRLAADEQAICSLAQPPVQPKKGSCPPGEVSHVSASSTKLATPSPDGCLLQAVTTTGRRPGLLQPKQQAHTATDAPASTRPAKMWTSMLALSCFCLRVCVWSGLQLSGIGA